MAISFISINAPRIAQWLGGDAIPFLFDKFTDVNLTQPQLDALKCGCSGGAGAALSLTLLLGGRLVDGYVAMTGTVDLCGRILLVGDVRVKIRHAMRRGAGLMIVPQDNLDDLNQEGWEEDEREYVERSVRGASTFVDVLSHAIEGKSMGEIAMVTMVSKSPSQWSLTI